MRAKKTQNNLDALRAKRDELTGRYKAHLLSYAAFANHRYAQNDDDKSLVMIAIEWCLVENIQRGIEQSHGQDVTFLFSVAIEAVTRDYDIELLEKENGNETYVRPEPETHFREVIAWYMGHFTAETATVQGDELLETLHQLHEEKSYGQKKTGTRTDGISGYTFG